MMYDQRYMGSNPNEGNEIVNILIRRDGMSPNDAWTYFESCQNEFREEYGDSPSDEEVESAVHDYFGLEPDYIFDFFY